MTNREYKERARVALRGYYMPFVLSRLLFLLVTTLIAAVSGNIYSAGISSGLGSFGLRAAILSGSVIFGLTMDIVIMFLGFVFAFGYIGMGLKRNRGEAIDINMVFAGFTSGSRPFKMVGISAVISILSMIIMFVPAIFIITGSFMVIMIDGGIGLMTAGIVLGFLSMLVTAFLNLSFAFAIFIIIDHPEYGIMEALKCSYRMMRGNRLRLFGLVVFGFIGWHILNLFSMGLLSIWLEPYILSSVIQFYMDINGENRQRYYDNAVHPESEYKGATYTTGSTYTEAAYPEEAEDELKQLPETINKESVEESNVTRLNGEIVDLKTDAEHEEEAPKSKTFEELMEELYKENKLKNDNYFGKGDKS